MPVPYFLHNLVPRKEPDIKRDTLLISLASLTLVQWLQVFCGWLAWTCDAVDFFSVSLSVNALSAQFGGKKTSTITTSITLTLLFRPLGAAIFGILSDRFGRRWPLVANLLFCCVFQVGSGFVQTFHQFLALRCLFGIAMGGVWGLAAATALENLPVATRGFISGIVQQGYAVGYLFAACVNLKLVPAVSAGWRSLFWTAAGMSAFAAFIRAITPESELFLRARRVERGMGMTTTRRTQVFLHEMKEMLKKHWMLCVYAFIFMMGLNFLAHGSQDLYPTYLENSKGFTAHQATIATIIGNCGAIAGGAFTGWASQYVGRRLTIIFMICLTLVFIPLWILPSTFSPLAAGAFCIQFGVQGALGVIPIYLSEISPPAFRGVFTGVTYQLGNMVSAASAQIEATAGEHLRTTLIVDGRRMDVPDYAKVQGILIGVVCVFVAVVTLFGPENHGAHFEKAKTAFEAGAETGEMEDSVESEKDSEVVSPTSIREEELKEDV